MYNESIRTNIPEAKVRAMFTRELRGRGVVSTPHYHDELEFLPIIKGKFCCTVYDTDYIAESGDVIFINSGVPHSTSRLDTTLSGLLQFKESDFLDAEISKLIKYSVRFQGLKDDPIRIIRDKDFYNSVLELLYEADKKQKAYDMYIKSGVYKILGYLYRNDYLSDSEQMYKTKEIQKIIPALQYINTNYYDDITLESTSEKLNFDPSYFCRIFKSATGATFTEYLNFVRICKAERLLAKTTDSILEISEAVGFSSVSYFNRIFKKYKNTSPRYFRSAKFTPLAAGEKEQY